MNPAGAARLTWVSAMPDNVPPAPGPGRPVVHFEILGEDGARLQAYYAALFGWSFTPSPVPGYGLVVCEGEGPGIGGGIGGMPGYPGHVTFYVSVLDVEAALVEAERLGGRRVMGPERVAEGIVIGQLTDPEGHLVGVVAAG
jgi:predicted enzyme related to lactoylglutathione lyase